MKLSEVQENLNISEEGDRKFQYNSLIKFDKLFEGDGEIENKFGSITKLMGFRIPHIINSAHINEF